MAREGFAPRANLAIIGRSTQLRRDREALDIGYGLRSLAGRAKIIASTSGATEMAALFFERLEA